MTSVDGSPYPAHWEADVVLRDGSTMHIRPILPSDADALQAFHRGQSAQSTYFRFFAPMERLSATDLARFTRVDHQQRVALVLVHRDGDHDRIVAVGRFDRLQTDGEVAEVAFNVSDAAQGKGLGSILLEHLAAAGRELGVRRFVADVLPSNARMLRVFSDAGYETFQSFVDGVVEVTMPIRPTDRSLAVLAERERRAEALSMTALLAADAVLVHHAGDEGDLLAARVLDGVRASGFGGRVEETVSLADLDALDGQLPTLAVVAAAPDDVLAALPVMAAGGVRAVVLMSDGFTASGSGTGPSQRTLMRTMREHGLRLVGPRSYGVLAHGRDGMLPATLATDPIQPGDIGVFCQSSAAARRMLEDVRLRGMGLASFLASGRRLDISGNDAMQYWSSDQRVRVACVYLESIGNPRKFSRVTRGLSATTPIVAAIAGTTGQQRLPGHRVRVSTAPRRVLEQLMRQSGILLAGSVRQQLDWAMMLASQPLPRGDRVVVVSNSGSQATVIADLVREHGLQVADREIALLPTVSADQLATALSQVAARDDWDMAIVAYGPFGVDLGPEAAAAIARLSAEAGRPVAALVLGRTGLHPDLTTTGEDASVIQVPGYVEPADAVGALTAARTYARRSSHGILLDPPDVDRRRARDLVHGHLLGVPAGTTVRLGPEAVVELLAAFGITVWPATRVATLDEAIAAASTIGWPVALKASDEVLRHRADLGGVRLDLSTEAELSEAFHSVMSRLASLGRHSATLEVQRMAPAGAACVVTGVEDELYGPIVSFGLAGDAVELLDDVAYRIPPLTDTDVHELVRAVGAAPRLLGYRGLPPLDIGAVEDVAARLGVLKEELPEVRSVALNPVLVNETGLATLSATIDLAPATRGDFARRALP